MKHLAMSITLAALVLASISSLGCSKNPPAGEPPPGGSAGPGGPHAMPAETYTACDGKKADDACTVKLGDREQTGKCASPPPGAADARLSCRPERPEKKPE